MAELGEVHPWAALLFTFSLPSANVYGILPANPREYKALVWPASQLTFADIEFAIEQQVEVGLLHKYSRTTHGVVRDLLYIKNYHRYQDVKWYRVGRPEYPLPPEWIVPEELRAYLERKGCERPPEFYGLCEEVLDWSRTTPGPLPDRSCEDSDSDTDTDTEERIRALGDLDFDGEDTDNGTSQRLFEVAEPSPPSKPKLKEDTPEQACIRRAWNAHGFDTTPGPTSKSKGKAKGSTYSSLMQIVKQHGIPLVDEWTAMVKAEGPQVPDGADPWEWFCTRMRDAFKAVWKWHADGGGADARERERREFEKPGWTAPSGNHPKVGGVYVHGVGVIPAKAGAGTGEMDPGAESDS